MGGNILSLKIQCNSLGFTKIHTIYLGYIKRIFYAPADARNIFKMALKARVFDSLHGHEI